MSEFKNIQSDAFWLKTLYLILFYFLFRLSGVVLIFVAIIQWAYQLITGKPEESLTRFGYSLGIYVGQIAHYLSGVKEEKPYPFSDWPEE